jgi:hypothetical protein
VLRRSALHAVFHVDVFEAVFLIADGAVVADDGGCIAGGWVVVVARRSEVGGHVGVGVEESCRWWRRESYRQFL